MATTIQEMVFASTGSSVYVFRANGSEWLDGDANPATHGVFKVIAGGFNAGTPALAALAGPGPLAIIYGGVDGLLSAWKPDGSNVPGFPVNLGAPILGSVAVGRLDGAGGPLSIVVPVANGQLHVRRCGWNEPPGIPGLPSARELRPGFLTRARRHERRWIHRHRGRRQQRSCLRVRPDGSVRPAVERFVEVLCRSRAMPPWRAPWWPTSTATASPTSSWAMRMARWRP
jgi:hypothetical protein